jgi:hypothetical protein
MICRLDALDRHRRAVGRRRHMEKPMRTLLLAVLFVLLAAPAFSQGFDLSHIGEKTRSPAQEPREQEIDQAYKSATKKIPSQHAQVDPWHNVRGASPSRDGQAKP